MNTLNNQLLFENCFVLCERNWKKRWFPLANRLSFLVYVSIMCLPRPSLYRPRHYFWHFFLTCTSHSSHSLWPTSMRAGEAWHSPEALSQSWAAGVWGSSLQFCSVLAASFLLPPPLLILPFYFQPASEYNTEEPCAVNRDTHPWVYTHIHTFKSHWKRQDQRQKEEQTPLRCWAWLHVPLDTDGRTQDICCLLFMEGPSATLHALFILRLLKGHSQEPQGKRTNEMENGTHCIYCMQASVCLSMCMKDSACMLLHVHVQWECPLIVQSWALLFFPSFLIECVLFAQLELVQCEGDREAILFHWNLSHNKDITESDVNFLSDLMTMQNVIM